MRGHWTWVHRTAIVGVVAAVLAVALFPVPVAAVTATAPTTTLSDYTGAATGVTYTFSGYTVSNGETATGAVITFPAGTGINPASLTLLSPAGSIQSVVGQTVTVLFTPSLTKGTAITISLGGITNPSTPGVYSVGTAANPGTITFNTANPNNNAPRAPQFLTSPSYTITPPPVLSMTITTPDDPGLLVDFGNIDPGVPTAAKQVTVAVTSSAGYTITRTLGGSATALGLNVTGTATGTKPAGTGTWTDRYVLTPPWTTDPGVTLTATVVYTVTQ